MAYMMLSIPLAPKRVKKTLQSLRVSEPDVEVLQAALENLNIEDCEILQEEEEGEPDSNVAAALLRAQVLHSRLPKIPD